MKNTCPGLLQPSTEIMLKLRHQCFRIASLIIGSFVYRSYRTVLSREYWLLLRVSHYIAWAGPTPRDRMWTYGVHEHVYMLTILPVFVCICVCVRVCVLVRPWMPVFICAYIPLSIFYCRCQTHWCVHTFRPACLCASTHVRSDIEGGGGRIGKLHTRIFASRGADSFTPAVVSNWWHRTHATIHL